MATWSDLFGDNGYAAIGVHSSAYTGVTPLTPAQLDITQTDAVQAVLKFKSIRLIPESAFADIAGVVDSARETLKRASSKFAMIPGARLVRLDRLDTLISELKVIRLEHEAVVGKFEEKFETFKTEQLPVIEAAFETALKIDMTDPFHPEQIRKVKLLGEIMESVRNSYPTAREAAGKFRLYWSSPFSIDRSKGATDSDTIAAETQDVKNVIRGIVEELRTDLSAKVVAIRELVQKGGKLTKRTTNSAREALARLKDLNIVGDSELIRQVDAVEQWLNRIDSDSAGAVAGGLVAGLEQIEAAVAADTEAAVEAAERSLTQVGRRRFVPAPDVQPEMPADTEPPAPFG